MQETSPHLAELDAALRREQDGQRRAHEALLALDLGDRVASGVTWSPLEVRDVVPAGRRLRVTLMAPRGSVLHDGIGSGDPVQLGTPGAPDQGPTGLCIGVEGRHAELLVEDEVEGVVAVTRRFDPSTFQRYREALRRGDAHRSQLRDVLLGLRPPGPVIRVAEPASFDRLDEAQRRAGRLALGAEELAVVHGPPGTGKTRLITALVEAWVADGERPWALADSNAAVDHLAVQCAERGLTVVRLGHPSRIGSAASALSEEAWLARGPLAGALTALDRDIARARGDWRRRRELAAERDALSRQARDHLLKHCDVLASTLGTLARRAPELPPATTAIVDEATQAVEPAAWVAVPWVQRLVLVGDPCQLGPVVVDPGNPLQRSLLQRLIEDQGVEAPMLEVHHRMHADIEALLRPVYGPRYRAAPAVAGHRLCDLPGVASTPLTEATALWIDTAGSGHVEERDPTTCSMYNEGEVEVVARAVPLLQQAGVQPDAIAVIAPYAAQVARLRAVVPEGCEVATVNAFQGREKEAVICSFVRSNDTGDVGFVADPRRLTVALSRARRFLLCTGDSATLAGQPRFAEVLDAVAAQGGLRSVFEEPWST